MRKFILDEINKNIELNKINVNEKLINERQSFPRIKTNKVRSRDEVIALTEVAKASIKKAEKEGKFIVTGERKLYYDPS